MSVFDVTVSCTSCSQSLVLSAQDLRTAFTCPRCGNTMPATQLVQLSMPLRAVPAATSPGPIASTSASAWTSAALDGSAGQSHTAAPEYQAGRVVYAPQQPGVLPSAAHGWANPEHRGVPPQTPTYGGPEPPRVPTPVATEMSNQGPRSGGRVARALGDMTWWLDRATYGRRLLYLSIAGVAVLATKRFAVDAYVPALFVYSSFLYLLLLARLWWVRDDNGTWSWRCFAERSAGAIPDAFTGLFKVEELSLQYVLEQLQLFFLASGLALAVVAPPLGALARWALTAGIVTELLSTLETAGKLIFCLGLLPWLLKRLRGRSAAAKVFKRAAVALATRESPGSVPLIVDVRQSETWTAGVPAEFHPLLGALARWKPRANERESGYERSLVRFLERNIPGIDAQTQLPFQAEDGTRGRIDVVLDDVVAIELKRDLRVSADADRAVGQVLKYAASWRKGPVILLLVEASAEVADLPVLKRIAELRDGGRSLFVVAAGRWRS